MYRIFMVAGLLSACVHTQAENVSVIVLEPTLSYPDVESDYDSDTGDFDSPWVLEDLECPIDPCAEKPKYPQCPHCGQNAAVSSD
jgi:hypothetical protein